ncbi:LOW QUALITY PROTEIN: male-enhanced antigen 1 [Trichechus manatus latirostris]|uniref:Male-enhanced antigen 1 n=1 Tax=Trichechus manatus latirostris TaxID=127582 RepID=A0A2Y9DS39_TRIMA|nr:LOW QUALITY PROTEIN: male-enhanced antigen 1 [Trichechus manatus latirostris]
MTEAGQKANSCLACVNHEHGRGWRTWRPNTSCGAGSEGAGSTAGSERPLPRMAALVLAGDIMGPERIFPNQTEELGPHVGSAEGTGDWSSEEHEEEPEEAGAGPAGYSYQPLNQDPEQEEVELAPVGDGEDVIADIQERIQALGLHLPDPPLESEDEEEEGATALSNHNSIPMDPEHVELVKRTMAGISLPAPGVPAWAREISDAQWEDVVQKALQARQASPAWK